MRSELNLDHFKCYEAATKPGTPQFIPREVTLVDQFMEGTATVRRPTKWCDAVDKNREGIRDPAARLECYDIRDATVPSLNVKATVTNQFGTTRLLEQNPLALCVPSREPVH